MKHTIEILIFCFLFFSCNKEKTVKIYYDNGCLKETREFFFHDDTSSYYLTSFFPNGKIMEEGIIIHSKKEGLWKRWFADDTFRGKIFYNEGEPDFQYKEKGSVNIVIDVDSLKKGIQANVKIINLYPYEGISCDGTKTLPSQDETYSDFIIIPDNEDSVHFYYADFRDKKNLVVIDSVKLKASEITNPAQYNFTEEDLKNIDSVILITSHPKHVLLKSFPVYK